MITENWVRDRRPIAFIDFFSNSSTAWAENPRAVKPWWYAMGVDGSGNIVFDKLLDTKSYNYGSDPLGNTHMSGTPNGVPDQFEELYHRMRRAYAHGYRRIVLQLPAGVAFGTTTGETYQN